MLADASKVHVPHACCAGYAARCTSRNLVKSCAASREKQEKQENEGRRSFLHFPLLAVFVVKCAVPAAARCSSRAWSFYEALGKEQHGPLESQTEETALQNRGRGEGGVVARFFGGGSVAAERW
eukprot:357798-Chlamydomonas_euryale.AAC.18